jgi:hypothetical protein
MAPTSPGEELAGCTGPQAAVRAAACLALAARSGFSLAAPPESDMKAAAR